MEESWERMARYRARFLTWKTGRPVGIPDPRENHWYHQPLIFMDTRENVAW